MSGSDSRKKRGFLEDSSLIREYLVKYRKWLWIGLLALVIVDVIDILPPLFLKYVVDIVVERRPVVLLGWAALAYLGISLVQGVCRYLWRMYIIRASIFAGRDIRGRYTHHLFNLSASFYDRHRIGGLMSLATNDVEAVRVAVGSGLLVFADALFYLLTVPVAMLFLSPQLTLLACLPMLFIPWIALRNEKIVHQRFERVQECFGRISGLVQENLSGIRVVKAFGQEDSQLRRLQEVGKEYIDLNLSLAGIQSAVGPAMDLCMSLGMVVLLFWGGGALIHDPKTAITLGTFVAFQRYIQKMVWPMAAVGLAVNFYQRAVSSSYRLKEILSIQTDVPDAPEPISPRSRSAQKKPGRVEFRNLYFSFPAVKEPVLKGISLEVTPGERIAFVGSIGAGKSTLLSLLPRLYPVQRGMLWVDGLDVNDWPIAELRRQVGYVGQEVMLFSETVQENVGFGLHGGLPGDSSGSVLSEAAVSPLSVEEAARLAEVHEEILGFSGSYGTQLGERGVNLSGGQKQRLTIARALAIQPSILVLDDALSSVDVQTEERILKALRSRPGRNTELIAAHRISTVKDADRIVVLQAGSIVQMGTHSELIRKRGKKYWSFYEQQRFKEDLENYQNDFH